MGCSHSSVINQVRSSDRYCVLQQLPQHETTTHNTRTDSGEAPVVTAVAKAKAQFHDRISRVARTQRWEGMGIPNTKLIWLQYRDLRPEDFELLCELDEGIPRKGTLPAGVVAQLPHSKGMDHNTAECRVCLASFSADAVVVQLPCRHIFHADCASRWLDECKGTCPICGLRLLDACAVP